jgi:hypothetical protein
MLKKTIALLILFSFAGVVALEAEPAPSSKKKSTKKVKKEAVLTPAKPLPEGWSLVDGVWMHSDGYKFVKGQLFRTGSHTHKRPPSPPTKAQMEAATKRNRPPQTAAEIAAAKAAERERNLRPRPAPQTGSNL